MHFFFNILRFSVQLFFCSASYHEQYRVPLSSSNTWESYIFNDKEYLVQNLPVSWENAKILCRYPTQAFYSLSSPVNRGHHNGTLAVLDTREKAEFLAEALSESQFSIESVWVGARRDSAEDPAGYRWSIGVELRRTALDVLKSEGDGYMSRQYPMWLNRTHVPVPDGGADCVAMERVTHDKPVFLDLGCNLERPFVCQRDANQQVSVNEVKTVRCRASLYHVYDGSLDWHQAAAYCVMRKMSLANIGTMRCLKKLGMTMLKTRPSIENAWIGARGSLGKWNWVDTGVSIFQPSGLTEINMGMWPPMRDRKTIKQSGCLQLDRHASHPPVFLEARCERKMQFICYQSSSVLRIRTPPSSDDNYYYILVQQLLYWQHAYENCLKMNGTLASIESNEIIIQLLLLMGENKDLPISHIWISGRLNMSRDITSDTITYTWYNPYNGKRIPDPKSFGDATIGLFMPPWLEEDFTTDSSCLNMDRQDHLSGLVYGLPCDTPQYSICMIEKSSKTNVENKTTDGYESV